MKFDEQTLLLKLRSGNKRALREFYARVKPKLTRWVQQRVRTEEDVEEIVHDTFLAFLDSLPLFRGKSSLETFINSIARHELADYWRKKYAKKAILTVPFVDQVYTEKLYTQAQTAKAIGKVYDKLDEEQVMILQWKYEEGWSVKKIARQLGVSVKAAESRLYRARRAFQLVYLEIGG